MANLLFATRESDSLGSENPKMSQPSRGLVLAAQAHFERAIAKEPRFARAHAGLSSTWFQSAFLRYSDNPERDAEEARRFGECSVELDPLDPFANFAMGRTFWLRGDVEGSWPWLDRSITFHVRLSDRRQCQVRSLFRKV